MLGNDIEIRLIWGIVPATLNLANILWGQKKEREAAKIHTFVCALYLLFFQ